MSTNSKDDVVHQQGVHERPETGVKGIASSRVDSDGNEDTVEGGYTEEEDKSLVRKLDWHVSLHWALR